MCAASLVIIGRMTDRLSRGSGLAASCFSADDIDTDTDADTEHV
jgi:hypothetical protein